MNNPRPKLLAIAVAVVAIAIAIFFATQKPTIPASADTPSQSSQDTTPETTPPPAAPIAGRVHVPESSRAAEAAPPSAARAAADQEARDRQGKFWARMNELALMTDPRKVQALLASEYGLALTEDEVRALLEHGRKRFVFGIIDKWATKQPQHALAWVATVIAQPGGRWDFHQLFLSAAMKAMPGLNRDALARLLPDAPSSGKLLDLLEGMTAPASAAARILAVDDPAERAQRLKYLAQAWPDGAQAAAWARENLSGTSARPFIPRSATGWRIAIRAPRSRCSANCRARRSSARPSS